MNFLNLEYFLVLAEERNFSKAAARLFISQQSLSSHIRKIEQEYGLPLFDRRVPLQLTEAGQRLWRSAKVILDEKHSLEKQISDLRDFRMGDVVIATPYARGALIMPGLIRSFREEFPQVRVQLLEGTTKTVEAALYGGKADLALGFAIPDDERVVSCPLYYETMKIVVPNELLGKCGWEGGQPPADQPVPLSTFGRCPFIGLHISTQIGEILKKGFGQEGIEPNIVAEARNMFTMLALCCEGVGACMCPTSFLTFDNPLIDRNKLAGMTVFSLSDDLGGFWISISYLKNKYLSRAARAFISAAQKRFARAGEEGGALSPEGRGQTEPPQSPL